MIQQNTNQNVPTQADEAAAMTLIEHLVELRGRIVRAAIGVLLGLGVGLFLVLGPLKLVDIIILNFAPINPNYAPVQSVGTAETFTSYMSVALTVGIIVGMPVIVYQLLAFIVPGLTDRERRILFMALPFVMFFFLGGIAFGWFITVPTAIRFLIGFSDSAWIQTQPTLADFLGTITTLLLVNGVVFELPVIIYVLAFLGVVTAQQLGKYRRFAIVVVVIVAAFITPTGDPINLALLAIPMYLLYEVGVFLARFVPNRK
jgi:sec-independent protein translocase protein TatC